MTWNPDNYLRFEDERTRPSIDLVSQIRLQAPSTVVDLGCGPGNSTRVLAERWSNARVIGVDSSEDMIEAATAEYPDCEWALGEIERWEPAEPFDLVFSNAALQWVPDHGPLVERLFGQVAEGGALAFQVPMTDYGVIRELIREIALGGPWASRMSGPLTAITTETPAFYYDHLAPSARSIDMWVTEYQHVMDSTDAIVDWISSTGLRPFLAVLETPEEADEFVARLRARTAESYETRSDGKVLFPFKRQFVIAYA